MTQSLISGGVNPYYTLGPVIQASGAVTDTTTILNTNHVYGTSGGAFGIGWRAITPSSIKRVYVFATGFVGTPANSIVRGEIRNMAGAQNPGSTVRQAAVTATWANQTAGHWAQFDFSATPYTPTRGEPLFLNMYNAAVSPGTDYPKIITANGPTPPTQAYGGYGFKYCYTTTSGWTSITNVGRGPVFIVEYTDGTFDGNPFTRGLNNFYTSNTRERGCVIDSLDTPTWVIGAFFYPTGAINAIKIYQGNAAPGSTPYASFTPNGVDQGQGLMLFSTPVLLYPGIKYRSVAAFGSAAQVPAVYQIESSTDFAGLLSCGAYGNTMGYGTIDNGSGAFVDDKSIYGGVVLIASSIQNGFQALDGGLVL